MNIAIISKKYLAISIGLVIGLIGITINSVISSPKITSFSQCEKQGYMVLQTDPKTCRSPDGTLFTENKTKLPQSAATKSICVGGVCTPSQCVEKNTC